MEAVFLIAAIVAVVATALTITRLNPIHALLYLTVSLLAVAVVFFVLSAPFTAALEVIIYAGAIMVLFIFVVMMLNLGQRTIDVERQWLHPRMWIGPGILAAILFAELVLILIRSHGTRVAGASVSPKQVAIALYQPYLLGVELASFLLMGGLVGAYHLGVRHPVKEEKHHALDSHELRPVAGGNLVCAGTDRASRAS